MQANTGLSGLSGVVKGEVTFDYYVDYVNGNDTTGTGSSANPWKTVSKALSEMSNDQSLGVRDGTYYERGLSVALTGITIQADTGHSPIFTPADACTSWSKTAGQTNVYQATLGSKPWADCFNGAQWLDGVASVAACDAAENTYFWSSGSSLLYVHIAGGAEPTSVEAITQVSARVFTVSGTGNTIDGLTFQWSSPYAVRFTGESNTIQNCTVRYWGQWGTEIIEIEADNCVVSNVTGDVRTKDSVADHFVSVQANACTVTGCNFTGNGVPIHFDSGTGHLVTLSEFHEHAQQALFFAGNASGDVTYNIFHNSAYGTIRGDTGHSGTVNVHHNVLYLDPDDLPGGAHMLTGIHLHGDGSTWNVYHNVFFEFVDPAIFIGPDSNGSITMDIRNNIMQGNGNGIAVTDPAKYPALTTGYNSFYDNTTNFGNILVGDQGSNNVTDDPLFTDKTTFDFTLQTSPASPCIDAGVAISGINDDYLGNAPDIGRYETA